MNNPKSKADDKSKTSYLKTFIIKFVSFFLALAAAIFGFFIVFAGIDLFSKLKSWWLTVRPKILDYISHIFGVDAAAATVVLVSFTVVAFILILLIFAPRSTLMLTANLLRTVSVDGSSVPLIRTRLGNFESTYSRDVNRFYSTQYLKRRIENIEAQLGSSQQSKEELQVIEEEREKIVENAALLVSESVKEKIGSELSLSKAEGMANSSLDRITRQIYTLNSRALLAQWAGLVICGIGIFILWLTLRDVNFDTLSTELDAADWPKMLLSLTPRLSLVILIELVGLFFLKLFRSMLEEIRITHNEMTNIEMKMLAVQLASARCVDEMPHIIYSLADTERNVIIEKGQTTVELERVKSGQESNLKLVDTLTGLLKKK